MGSAFFMGGINRMTLHLGSETRNVQRWRHGLALGATDEIATEVPVAMVYNGISHAVMLASPMNLEAFGLGFSLSEGILSDKSELYAVDINESAHGIEIQMTIAQEKFIALKDRRRSIAGRTGCGLCGTESLQYVFKPLSLIKSESRYTHEVIQRALSSLGGYQELQAKTGAVHVAALVSRHGDILRVCEDVGRHNALDKLIGEIANKEGVDRDDCFVLVSSRASYEMVQKTITAGLPMLVAVSAPTDLAIRLAKEYNLTLVGFAREGHHVLYANDGRVG